MHSGVIDTAVQICKFKKISAESLTPLCKYDTAVTFDVIFARLWLSLKGISIEKTYIGQLSYTIPITFTNKKWGLTRDRFLSQRSHWPVYQGPRGSCLMKKNQRSKISCQGPFNYSTTVWLTYFIQISGTGPTVFAHRILFNVSVCQIDGLIYKIFVKFHKVYLQ
jgi:hypothetical protein